MVTIYDVASRAEVSAATVSRVLNGIQVSPAREAAVNEAIAELGFVRNRNARRLRMSSSEIVAMIVPDIENPFFSVMTRAVEDVVRDQGYSVMLCNTDEDPVREAEYLRAAVGQPVAGVIIAPSSDAVNLDVLVEREMPVVCVDRRAPGYAVDTVVADNVDAAAVAVSLLFHNGYKRVACITGPERTQTADERLEGWEIAVRRFSGQAPDPQLIRRGSYFVEDGERATIDLLESPDPPDAIFAANNRLAAGVLRVLSERNLLPPKTGVVSFGGLPLVLLEPIGVLVTHLPGRELGERAAGLLLERIGGSQGPVRNVVIPVTVGDEGAGLASRHG